MNTLSPKYYTQLLIQSEGNISPKSRDAVLREYFRLYLPSFSALYREVLEEFISGEVDYETLLTVFARGIELQEIRRQKRIDIFDQIEEKRYGPRSLPPLPSPLTRNPLAIERERFIEVFGPRSAPISPGRVPGTMNGVVSRIQGIGAW